MKKILHIFILLFAFTMAQAQTTDDKAKAYYQEAQKAFESRNYKQTIDYCKQVTDLLKTTNARIELLRVKSYYELGEYDKVKASIKTFTNLQASAELKNEALEYLVKVEKAEKAAEEKRLAEQRRLEQERIAKEQKLAEERRQKEEAEAKSYTEAMRGDISAIRTFIKDYPNHQEKQNILDLLDAKEEQAYNNALVKNEVWVYENYLKEFYDGKNKTEINKRLNIVREIHAYEEVVRNKSVDECENYLLNYRNGENIAEVLTVYEQVLNAEAEQAMLTKEYTKAKSLYEKYKIQFPTGNSIKTVETNYNEAQRKIKKSEVLANRHDVTYFMVNYTLNGSIGIEFGKLNNSYRPSVYGGMHYGFKVPIKDFGVVVDDYQGDDPIKVGILSYSLGLTMKITHPLWIYAGADVSLFIANDYTDDEVLVYPEFGLKTIIGKKMVLKAGMQMLKNTNVYQFGLGIGF